jgi:hypothetical protein
METILFCSAILMAATTSPAAVVNAEPAIPAVQMKLIPKGVYGDAPSQLLVTTKGAPLAGLKLSLRATHGFRVNPPEVQWSTTDTHSSFVVIADVYSGSAASPSSGTVIATVSRIDSGAQRVITNEFLDFDYQPVLPVCLYLVIGAAGVAIGYLLRLAIRALSETQPPQTAALAAQPSPAGLRAFVLKHYYWLDFGVTLVLALLVLMSLMKDGHPPSNAPYWYSALGIGVGLGLLTNSDLLTKVK